jgi:hypothetical protein
VSSAAFDLLTSFEKITKMWSSCITLIVNLYGISAEYTLDTV